MQAHLGALGPRGAEVIQEKPGGGRSLAAGGLLERGEAEHLRVLVIVDADDAQRGRNGDAESSRGDDRPDGDLIARGDDGRGASVGIAQQVDGHVVAARE